MTNQPESIGKRIELLIKELHMTNNSFAKSIGKSSTAINQIVDGKNKPGFDVLENIFQTYPQVSPDFLMKGEGEMFRLGNKPEDGGSFGSDVLDKVVEEFRSLKNQLSIKDKQIDGLQRTADSLQRTVDTLLGQSNKERSFPKPVSTTGRVIALYPKKVA